MIRCRRAPKPKQVRPIFPVLAGIRGRKRTTCNMVFDRLPIQRSPVSSLSSCPLCPRLFSPCLSGPLCLCVSVQISPLFEEEKDNPRTEPCFGSVLGSMFGRCRMQDAGSTFGVTFDVRYVCMYNIRCCLLFSMKIRDASSSSFYLPVLCHTEHGDGPKNARRTATSGAPHIFFAFGGRYGRARSARCGKPHALPMLFSSRCT